jgi:hypothetical protein
MRRVIIALLLAAACGDGGTAPVVGTPVEVARSSGNESAGSLSESPGMREVSDDLSLTRVCSEICDRAARCIPSQGCRRDCLENFQRFDSPECARALRDFGICVFGGCPTVVRPAEDCVTAELLRCQGDT